MCNIENIIDTYINKINNIHNDVNILQKRKSKYMIKDIFSAMIKSSFNNNNYCDFLSDYNLDLISTGNFSYWSVKIYDINLDNMYNMFYNISKNELDYQNNNNCRFTKCATFVR